MIIHFSILAVILSVSWLWEKGTKKNKIYIENYVMPRLPWIIIFGYIAFLAAMRSDINDTFVYRHTFDIIPGSLNDILNIIIGTGKDKGFDILANLFKMIISDNYHLWFALFSIIESIIFVYILRRESLSILDSCFFLFTSTLYYNYFSMMRQWFAIALFFWAFRWLKEKKFIPYLLICLFAAQFHSSAYFCIPIYFFVQDKPWSRRQLILIFIFITMLLFLNPLLNTIYDNGSGTYSYVFSAMNANTGASPIRILISVIPITLSFLYRKKIDLLNNKTLNLCINMSIINFLLNIVAAFTSGLYLIRMATYFNIFNIILFPFLLEKILKGSNRKIIKICFYIFYFIFYCYQMKHQDAFGYNSDILGTF